MIEVSHLTKTYQDLKAVDDVSFQVPAGEILGFLGPNGAGKTTTMRILTGVLPPSSGTVKVSGFDVFEQPLEVKKRIGYLPENPPLYIDMTVRSYLRFVASIKGVPRKGRDGEVERV
ncbi:MAG: ATP-binding cassette domain-containing protein, partial [Myxococcales bacterium]